MLVFFPGSGAMRRSCASGPSLRAAALLAVLSLGVASSAHAMSFNVSRGTIQAQAEKAFPKQVSGVELTAPDVRFEGAREVAVLCGRWTHLATSAEGTFCAETRLRWNREPGTVSLSAARVRRVSFADGRSLPQVVLQGLNALIARQVEGVVVYTAPKLVGWAVKDLTVTQDGIRVGL